VCVDITETKYTVYVKRVQCCQIQIHYCEEFLYECKNIYLRKNLNGMCGLYVGKTEEMCQDISATAVGIIAL
jgi:hypothetical protein